MDERTIESIDYKGENEEIKSKEKEREGGGGKV
jgi:hypothetical protein